MVTPFMGVWIEIVQEVVQNLLCNVTPFMGVWIEIMLAACNPRPQKSHPLWVCGLKYTPTLPYQHTDKSHPLWVCGLK